MKILVTKRLADVAPEVNLRGPLQASKNARKRGIQPAFETQADIIRSPKRGYQWPHKKDLCPPNCFFFPKTIEKKNPLTQTPSVTESLMHHYKTTSLSRSHSSSVNRPLVWVLTARGYVRLCNMTQYLGPADKDGAIFRSLIHITITSVPEKVRYEDNKYVPV